MAVASLLALLLFGTTGCFSMRSDLRSYAEYPSPDGRHVLVVKEWVDLIDGMFPIELHSGGRIFEIGCVNGDSGHLGRIRWLSADTVEIDASGDLVKIAIDGGRVTESPPSPKLHACSSRP